MFILNDELAIVECCFFVTSFSLCSSPLHLQQEKKPNSEKWKKKPREIFLKWKVIFEMHETNTIEVLAKVCVCMNMRNLQVQIKMQTRVPAHHWKRGGLYWRWRFAKRKLLHLTLLLCHCCCWLNLSNIQIKCAKFNLAHWKGRKDEEKKCTWKSFAHKKYIRLCSHCVSAKICIFR